MSIALKELLRQPRRFSAVGIALTLMVVLLVVLGGFLDGLELSQTGAYRAHEGRVLVFDDEADRQLARSRVSEKAIEELEAMGTVAAVGRLDATFTVAGLAGEEVEDIALFGYELSTDRLPVAPPVGTAVIDEQLRRVAGVDVGDTLQIGPTAEPVTVTAVVDDLTNGAPTVWVTVDEWRRLVAAGNPAAVPPEGVSQALVIDPTPNPSAVLNQTREDGGPGGLDLVTVDEAIQALDVVQQQSSTFSGIISVTLVITLLVVALFFALITLERVGLYAVLKALGARTGELLLGVSAQAVVISAGALVIGIGLSAAFVALLPPQLPIRVEPSRLIQVGAGVIVTAILGSLFTARRLLRIDPAEAIG